MKRKFNLPILAPLTSEYYHHT